MRIFLRILFIAATLGIWALFLSCGLQVGPHAFNWFTAVVLSCVVWVGFGGGLADYQRGFAPTHPWRRFSEGGKIGCGIALAFFAGSILGANLGTYADFLAWVLIVVGLGFLIRGLYAGPSLGWEEWPSPLPHPANPFETGD